MAAVAEPILADMVAEGRGLALAVRFDRPFSLAARVAHNRASTLAGGILALQPAVSFHPLVVVEAVVGFQDRASPCRL